MNILQVKKYYLLIKKKVRGQAKFILLLLKALEKQMKAIESQGEKQAKTIEEHGQQLVKPNGLDEYGLSLDKQKEIFQNLVDERIGEIKKLHKSIDFVNLIYYFKSKNADIGFNYFIDGETLYGNLKPQKIKIDVVEKNQM